MDFLAPMLVLITAALVFGSVLRSYFVNRRLRDNARLWVELQGKVVDRFGSAPEVVRYLESDAGQRMLEGQVTSSASPHARILDAVHTGLLVFLGGIGLQAASAGADAEVRSILRTVGTVGSILGVGFLASAAISWFLLRRWGLLSTPAAPEGGESA
jgi:heme/copper-type cytochrome/quinol oxidase subunit 3